MSEKTPKIRTGFYIETDLLKKCDALLKPAGVNSRNEFVNEAIRQFVGSMEAQDSQQYLAEYITAAISGAVGISEKRLARLLFKQAVELSIMMNVLAAVADVDEPTLRRLRAKCVEDVKKSNGSVSFEDAVKFQKQAE
ncbi:ribbon-helix-helix domain-containing protein [Ruminococcaceae bacterium OttesenSCG-928-L11]|nr:ribbon-helix-helix domain-containing protein [Ruminococcaceae bacterium OttesenSCG-928-L11]